MNRFRANTGNYDPVRGFNFEVVFSGRGRQIYRTGFQKVTGVKSTINFVEYKEGGNNGVPDKIPSDVNFEPITMTHGVTDSLEFPLAYASQFNRLGAGMQNTYTIDIYLKDRDNRTVIRHTRLLNAMITSFQEGDLDAQSSAVAINTIIVTFSGVDYLSV